MPRRHYHPHGPEVSGRQEKKKNNACQSTPTYQVPRGGVATCLAFITLEELLHSRGAVQTEEWAVHPWLGQQLSQILQ